jgi:type IV pilus assembly protein PilM
VVQLPDDALAHREIVNSIAVVDSLKALTSSLKLKSKNVCTALSGPSMMIKRLQLEVPNPKEIQEQVFWEAENYIPFDHSDLVMDFEMLSRSKDSLTDVMLVAAKRTVVDSFMGVISDSGLQPKVVDADFFALQNVYEANYPATPGESVALIDIGATGTKMVVLSDGIPVFTKDSAMGGRTLTTEIQRQMGHSLEDAESLKLGGAGGIPQEVLDILRVGSENLATEIKAALNYYSASSVGAPVGPIYLSGGCSLVPGLPQVIEEVTGRPVQYLNPFGAIAADPAQFSEDYLRSISALAVIPVGLALRAGS